MISSYAMHPALAAAPGARTPEQLYFFYAENQADEYHVKQLSIASKAIKQLGEDGIFFYITCSVFSKENEEVVAQLQQKGYDLVEQKYYTGYADKADSLFVAVLQRAQ